MKLVICEKNIAARRIAYFLSKGNSKSKKIGRIPCYEFDKDGDSWRVIGLKGHIINLDYPSKYNRWNKIPPKELINIEPRPKVSKKSIASALKTLVDKNPYLIVATDFDREGELIGVEAIELIKDYNSDIKDIKRAHFSAITGYEIKNAFDNLTKVNYNLSSAGKSRQIIDLVWGAVLTRFISIAAKRYGKEFLSVGRVQSPTLALLVEKEKQIENFKPKSYWKIIAVLNKKKIFSVSHSEGQFWDEKKALEVYDKVKDAKKARVKSIDKKEVFERPPSPFSTTSFLKSASALGVSASSAMSIAEDLYMSGLISYPRTDNTVYPRSLNIKGILNKLKNSSFSKEATEVIENGRKYPTRGKKQTTDHPPIHPVGVPKGTLKGSKHKIYELIVRRFLSTLAKDAVSEISDVVFDISDEEFKVKGYRLLEANWKDIYVYFKGTGKEIPDLEKDETVDISKVNLDKDETKPPKRYTQGSLISKMEDLSLGTKSTRHEIINKLYSRRYIILSPLKPTPIGRAVIDAMNGCDVVKPKMTAELEEDMDQIAEGKKTLEETIEESREMLTKVMDELEKEKDKIKENIKKANRKQNLIGVCPKCGKDLVIRKSRNNKRFVGCSGYPDCKNTYSLPQRGGVIATGETCEYCNAPVVKIISKGKRPWKLCINSECSNKKPRKPKNK